MSALRSRSSARLAVITFLMMVPLSSGWLIGDLSSRGFERSELDTPFADPAITPAVSLLFGIGSISVTIFSGAMVLYVLRTRVIDGRWIFSLVMAAFLGVMLGFAWRVMTAGVIGANVGAGFLMIFGGPFLVMYLVILTGVVLSTYRKVHRHEQV